ncbi:hypothetical protein SAMN05216232_2960 [Virgibacillus subterraneus]|uniref:Uncharacterized protein n=2 Tax=Virgibacillus TaxID=84406 RepID=A0A1H1CNT6_9BACI|nr:MULTISPECIES: hypothetical protein [Virgibacillus]SDQ65689.1 hypothetical protein SAMN05216231_2331 [Virgibacillus salinus]SEQ64027.1 hypothetical protein SAMN05216232_2960 [Virgibacillus subterraneus]
MKKGVFVLSILSVFLLISFYWFYEQAGAELTVNQSKEIQQDEFILHIRVEKMSEGFQVFRSIQYIGEEQVEITHQTPLISVSLKHKNHDYTGSNVTRVLTSGSSYHPQGSKTFEAPGRGEYTLFCESRFNVDGEEIKINYQENLMFN